MLERKAGAAPLHDQLESGLRELVRSSRLTAGARLPSSRALARTLDVSRGVVLEAYTQLSAEGYLSSTQGAPTRVADTPSAERAPLPASSLANDTGRRLDPDLPDVVSFPHASWLRSYRAALRRMPFSALGDTDPRGAPELRDGLMEYLGRVRGAAPEPEHTLITSGFTQAFALLCATLRARGVETIAVEDPGWATHRMIAEHAGLVTAEVPVDDGGISVRALAATGCEVVVLTPAHQYPTGVVLAPERRAELLEWAQDGDGLIVEDDYDSELRYDRVPVGALQGLAAERVCHIGSTGTRLAPGIRIGWTLSPSWLTGSLTYEQAVSGGGAPVLDQLALADFIARGELDRHLRRMRLRYRSRREQLLAALDRKLPEAIVSGVAAGVFVPVALPGVEPTPITAAAARGFGEAVSVGQEPVRGLVLGFGAETDRSLEDAVIALASILAHCGRSASGAR